MQEQDTTPERWKPVVGWPGYEVSDRGRMRSWKKCRRSPGDALPRALRAWALPSGYLLVTLKDRGRRSGEYIHKSVLTAFVGERPDGMEACHWNGDKSDNSLRNLRWDSPLGNAADKRRHGTTNAGEKHYAAQLTVEQAQALKDHPGSHTEAAAAFGVRYHLAYCIRVGRTWKHLR
jgi:hypothetical protein